MFHGLTYIEIDAALLGGYLLGSIPFGVIVMRLAGAGDPRAIGSGNIGATNVLRSGRRDLAALTLLGDGGKGVATFFGTLIAAAWPVGLLAGATWILMAALFRISSLAALTAVALAPLYAVFLFHRPYPIAVLSVAMAALVYIRHEANIRRLLKGEEPRMGGKKTPPESPAA